MKITRSNFVAGTTAMIFASALAYSQPGNAYKLATRSTPEERKLSGITSSYWLDLERAVARRSVSVFTEPVHEEITNRIYGCEGDQAVCAGEEGSRVPVAVLAGVRWNDDPPFRMSAMQAKGTKCKTSETIRFETQPYCWAMLFEDADRRAASGRRFGPGDAMLYRTHFGDLQFLHSMASRDGEPAEITRANLMGWIEFAWRGSLGEYTIDTRLRNIHIPAIQAAFGKTEWRLLDLYTQGASGGLRRDIDDVAFGSLLHAVEDSFAAGHVDREESSGTVRCSAGAISTVAPGVIREFHAYNQQDHGLHAEADSRASFMRQFQQAGHVVQVGRGLIEARAARLSWEAMSPLFECLFTVADPNAGASPGDYAKVD